jgi:hypothetical protein
VEPTAVHAVLFALLHAVELPAAPVGSKFSDESPSPSSNWSWQFPGNGRQAEVSRHAAPTLHGEPLPAQTPVWQYPFASRRPPLFRQSICPIQDVTNAVLLELFAQTALQLAKADAKSGVLEQSASPSLATQLSAAAVSWRASCSRIVALGLTQIASTADASSFTIVVEIVSPQTDSDPTALMTA